MNQHFVKSAALLLAAGLLTSAATAQSVTVLPFDPSEGHGTGVYGLSSDGLTVAGIQGEGVGNRVHVFRWTAAAGLYDITANENGFFSGLGSVAISGDGHTIAAQAGYRWTGPGTGQFIGNLHFPNNSDSNPFALSSNGNVIVGTDHYSPGGMGDSTQGYRWTASGGYQGLPFLQASDCTADGNKVLGLYSNNHTGIWDAATGLVTPLAPLPGDPTGFTGGYAMNPAGNIVVGITGNQNLPTIWRNGVPESLGYAPNGIGNSGEVGLTPDGSIVLGKVGLQNAGRATIWTQATGNLLATDYLALFGITIPGSWNLVDAKGVSDDGRTFLFQAFGPVPGGFTSTGILVTIPAPATLAIGGVALLGARRRR
ncbi:MAG: hypothetical protein GC200_10035 [Tepidisphaera sp.]|nr:hypothetical protein [Tepidisphaera sp.]